MREIIFKRSGIKLLPFTYNNRSPDMWEPGVPREWNFGSISDWGVITLPHRKFLRGFGLVEIIGDIRI